MQRGVPLKNVFFNSLSNSDNSQHSILNIDLRSHKIDESCLLACLNKFDLARVEILDLNYNRITRLFYEHSGKTVCYFETLVNLKRLDLSNNPIQLTHPINFRNCSSLKILTINNSCLVKETSLLFLRNLKSVKKLSIRSHQIYNLKWSSVLRMIASDSKKIIESLTIELFGKEAENIKSVSKIQSAFPRLKSFNGCSMKSETKIVKQLKGVETPEKRKTVKNIISDRPVFSANIDRLRSRTPSLSIEMSPVYMNEAKDNKWFHLPSEVPKMESIDQDLDNSFDFKNFMTSASSEELSFIDLQTNKENSNIQNITNNGPQQVLFTFRKPPNKPISASVMRI